MFVSTLNSNVNLVLFIPSISVLQTSSKADYFKCIDVYIMRQPKIAFINTYSI